MIDVVVEVADDDVVDVVTGSGVIANPQPCDGSFSASGSETGDCDGAEVDGGEVVVVVMVVLLVVLDGLVGLVVVDDVDDVVVEVEANVFFVNSSAIPVKRSEIRATERMIRSAQRRWGKALGELGILSSR